MIPEFLTEPKRREGETYLEYERRAWCRTFLTLLLCIVAIVLLSAYLGSLLS